MKIKTSRKQNIPTTSRHNKAIICPQNPAYLCNDPACRIKKWRKQQTVKPK